MANRTADNSTEKIQEIAKIIRGLSIDGVQAANSGHPGMPLGMADVAAVLWADFLDFNPQNPQWMNRDRFVLSNGHGSMLLYSLLHLFGYDLSIEDLKQFRQWHSKTPGHPEYRDTPGVETTTGPLGQGIANAVGMALAEASVGARVNTTYEKIMDHYTYVMCGDGDLEEGISHEVFSLAGHLQLSKLIVLYDDNDITIDGDTDLSFSDDTQKRFEAYGFDVQKINGHSIDEIRTAIAAAQSSDKPSIIFCKTVIGWGSPNKAGGHDVHGSPLGEEELRLTKENLGLPADQSFYVSPALSGLRDEYQEIGKAREEAWLAQEKNYAQSSPDYYQLWKTLEAKVIDVDKISFPEFEAGSKIATRNASGKVLEALVPSLPFLIGGSADLTPSNKTYVKGTSSISPAQMDGQYIHYGIREHGMAAIMNGIYLHGGVLPYAGTFFVFTDYMRPGLRMAALMGLPVIHVLTHDSIGLGEDGPTHQPIAHLDSLRAMPNMTVIRPMDGNETTEAWKAALLHKKGPTCLVLTRQNLLNVDRTTMATADHLHRGGYILTEDSNPEVVIIATGSEVEIALEAKEKLNAQGKKVRVVSMPCTEFFDNQTEDYRESVIPSDDSVKKIAIEAASGMCWYKYIGNKGKVIGLNHFGASAPYQELYEKFGISSDAIVEAVNS